MFKTDKQTITDLDIFRFKKDFTSILSFYDETRTKGGQELLFQVFNSPSTDLDFLLNRTNEIKLFFDNDFHLPLNSRSIDYIEYYLNIRRVPLKPNIIDATYNGISHRFNPDNDYYIITESIINITQLLISLKKFINAAQKIQLTKTINAHFNEILDFISSDIISTILVDPPEKGSDLSYQQINKLDDHFRVKEKESFRNLLTIVYEIDLLQSMSHLMKVKGLSLPKYVNDSNSVFEAVDSFHPLIENPVKNSFYLSDDHNLYFLTGPNMSGKSTFLKTVGLLAYISHLGLPVPAKTLEISLFDGLFTTINLSDNLNLGYSHFYTEVNRVREIATLLNSDKNLIVIFDELFRGTNVKDAYDASLMIISALAKIKGNLFFISTHIIEVAEKLKNSNSIIFKCFESELVDGQPIYDFKLKEGQSKERVGMTILKKEKIIQILEDAIKKQRKKHSL